MTRLLRYAGPDCPWGPAAGGFVFVAMFAIGVAFLAPPIGWVCMKLIGPWWTFWLG